MFRVFRTFWRIPELRYFRCRFGHFLGLFEPVQACQRPAKAFQRLGGARGRSGSLSDHRRALRRLLGRRKGPGKPFFRLFEVYPTPEALAKSQRPAQGSDRLRSDPKVCPRRTRSRRGLPGPSKRPERPRKSVKIVFYSSQSPALLPSPITVLMLPLESEG